MDSYGISHLWYILLLYVYVSVHWLGIYVLNQRYCLSFSSLSIIPLAFASFLARLLEYYVISYGLACCMVLLSMVLMWLIIMREDHGLE